MLWHQDKGFALGALARIVRHRLRRVAAPSTQDRKNHGNEDQRRHGRNQQSADHRAAQRRVLLAALTEAEAHGHHADDHRQGGHQHRAQTCAARFQRGADGIAMLVHLLTGKRDDQDRIGGGHANAHDRTHQRGHAQRRPRDEEHPRDARQRTRQAG